jgi:uncharacterized Rmd1/YagE family protein
MFGKDPEQYVIHAYHLHETLKLKAINLLFEGKSITKSATRLAFQEGERGFYFIYRFGSVIFFNMSPEKREIVLGKLKSLIGEKQEMIIHEEFALMVDPGTGISVEFDSVTIDEFTIERLDIVSMVLAQSTALEYFEIKVDEMLGRSADIGHALQRRGHLERRAGEIKKFIGQCITTKQSLVASLYLLDKPDETWEDQVLDKLYREAVDMFELKERYRTVDYKLRMIQENLELIADLLQYRHANFLEWAIIVLIAIEIVLFVLQLFILES